MKINKIYTLAFFIFLIIEIIIALFVRDSFIRPYMGDVLVIVLVYCFVRIFYCGKTTLLPFYVFIFAVFVELAQFFNVAGLLNLRKDSLVGTVIGTVFDFHDIICYLVGCIILFIWQKFFEKN